MLRDSVLNLPSEFTAVGYDLQRRLALLRATRAHVQRPGFLKACKHIAKLRAEDLLAAIALLGDTPDVRSLMRERSLATPDRESLRSLVLCQGHVLGTEGHRTVQRYRSVAAALHYGCATLFVTPNLADGKASLLVALRTGPDILQDEVRLPLLFEEPAMPSTADMMRTIAVDAVAQAKFFEFMITCFFTELLGTQSPSLKEFIPGATTHLLEDDWAASCFGGVFWRLVSRHWTH